jgi:hypothetical protein
MKNKETPLKWDCTKDGHLFEKFCWTEETTIGKTHHIVKICTACNKKYK